MCCDSTGRDRIARGPPEGEDGCGCGRCGGSCGRPPDAQPSRTRIDERTGPRRRRETRRGTLMPRPRQRRYGKRTCLIALESTKIRTLFARGSTGTT